MLEVEAAAAKVHEPGSRAQLEEVWAEVDGLDKEDFNAKLLFHLVRTGVDSGLRQKLDAII